MTRIAVLGVLVVIVGALVVSSAGHTLTSRAVQPADDPFLITPGVGIGKVKIGMPIAAVMSIMGNPKNICRGLGEGGKTDMYAWFEGWCTPAPRQPTGASPSNSGGGLVVYTDTKTVTRVEAYKDARYFLENGLRVGSAASLVPDRMGGNPVYLVGLDGTTLVQYPALGISFILGRGNVITSIGVHTPVTKL